VVETFAARLGAFIVRRYGAATDPGVPATVPIRPRAG